jgi:hypothetical protein
MNHPTAVALERGRLLFNAGRYFEAHDAWEEAWLREDEAARRLLQGLIQIAAALLKASRGERPRGCLLLLDWGLAKLDGIADSSAGLALAPFRVRLRAFRQRAERWRLGHSRPPPPGAFPQLARAAPIRRRTGRARRGGTRTPALS